MHKIEIYFIRYSELNKKICTEKKKAYPECFAWAKHIYIPSRMNIYIISDVSIIGIPGAFL